MQIDYPTQRPHLATVREVIDGDTLRVDIDLDLRVGMINTKLRLLGCNAAEHDTEGGKAAKAHLTERLPVGTEILLLTVKTYKYGGEFVARVFTDGGTVDLIEELIDQQWLAAWNGRGSVSAGTAPVPPWPRTVE